MSFVRWVLLLTGLFCMASSAFAEDIRIQSVDSAGRLVATNLQSGSTSTVEWASSPTTGWTNSWESLSSVLVDSNGAISVSVPRFYRVTGVPAGQVQTPLVIPDMVTIGHAGNEDDTVVDRFGQSSGAVSYTYKLGRYEVTNEEYVKFLNAVDPAGEDVLSLYNIRMSSSIGGISKDTNAVSGATYVTKVGFENKPVLYVSFYDAARFCNWLHNGAVVFGDTENGAYTLIGGTAEPSNGTNVLRNAGAQFAIPTEDEWYKAAYYDPENAGADSNGSTNYWLYPTMNDIAPTAEGPPGGTNSANYRVTIGEVVSDVGSYVDSTSYYGTFDQGGNVYEWCERLVGSSRILRGGSWFNSNDELSSEGPFARSPGTEDDVYGFRVSSP